ncbi:MAG: signal transduction histidine kinase [Verrucomicrobiales bacterium]|jgi:signal transduction histidine kinase
MDEQDFTSTMTPDDAERLRRRSNSGAPLLPRLAIRGERISSNARLDQDLIETPDQTEVFQQVIAIIRWGVLGLLIIIATPAIVDGGDDVLSTLLLGFFALTITRHARPIRFDQQITCDGAILIEIAMSVSSIAMTGLWNSPLAVSLTVPIIVAGFARGYVYAVRVALVATLVPSAFQLSQTGLELAPIQRILQWAVILVVVGLIAGQTRRITGEAGRQRSLAMNRMERLTDANSLLYSLHRVAQTLPASLDLNDVLDTTLGRMRSLFDYDSMALLVFDETDASWQIMRSEGTSMPLRLGPTMLPNPLKTAIAQNRLVDMADLTAARTVGLNANSESGLYTTLTARGQIIGLLAIESTRRDNYDERTVQMLNGFVDPVALAVDNARWFGRLRTMGADEERTRIARDLHDRIGQSMAFLAFELDRLIKYHGEGKEIGSALDQLQTDVRNVIREIRDTLSDLRTDVSDRKGLADTIADFAERLAERSGLEIKVDIDATERLPIMQERELWRIAQEAMVNVERHADATTATVRWKSNGEESILEIADNGRGFTIGESGRVDSYGLIGMRERAASVGASMEVTSSPEDGTTIRCLLTSETQPKLRRSAEAA